MAVKSQKQCRCVEKNPMESRTGRAALSEAEQTTWRTPRQCLLVRSLQGGGHLQTCSAYTRLASLELCHRWVEWTSVRRVCLGRLHSIYFMILSRAREDSLMLIEVDDVANAPPEGGEISMHGPSATRCARRLSLSAIVAQSTPRRQTAKIWTRLPRINGSRIETRRSARLPNKSSRPTAHRT